MQYFAIVKDNWEQCPGESVFGPFPTYKEAQWRAEHEVKAAAELFTDGRANLTFSILGR